MKPITCKGLLTLLAVFSAGRIGGAFVAPPNVGSIGHASSVTALQETAAAAAKSLGQEVLDFAIVGGGPAGLAAAVGLKRKGLAVKVFEAAPKITERGAAVFVQVCLELFVNLRPMFFVQRSTSKWSVLYEYPSM